AIAHGDLGHEPQVARDELRRRLGILVLGVALGEHVFLLRREDRKFLDLGQVAVEALLAAERRDAGRSDIVAAHLFPRPFLSADGWWTPSGHPQGAATLPLSYTPKTPCGVQFIDLNERF